MGDKHRYTLEQLASATGMTPRNVRAYQTRELISRPNRDGRRSVYGSHHVQQLLAIQHARAEGASLGLISGVIADGGRVSGGGLGWGARPASRRGSGGQTRRCDLQPVLDRISATDSADSPGLAPLVEQLARLGLARRRGSRTLIPRDVATGMIALHRQGLPASVVLLVTATVARFAQPLTAGVLEALEGATGDLTATGGITAGGITAAALSHAANLAAGLVHEALLATAHPDDGPPRD